jgi:NADH:ubiquinone oxidoreductase subunit 3 (subunit A)
MQTIEWVLYAIVLGVTLFLAGCVIQSLLERRRVRNKVRLEEKARSQNLAAGALHDVDLAFNPYDCDNDQTATQRQPLRLW